MDEVVLVKPPEESESDGERTPRALPTTTSDADVNPFLELRSSTPKPSRTKPRKTYRISYMFEPYESSDLPDDAELLVAFRFDSRLPYPPWPQQAKLFERRWLNAEWSERLADLYLVRFQLERLERDAEELDWSVALDAISGDDSRKAILEAMVHIAGQAGASRTEPIEVSGRRNKSSVVLTLLWIMVTVSRQGSVKVIGNTIPLPLRAAPLLLPLTLFEPKGLPPSAHLWAAVVLITVAIEPSDKMRYQTTTHTARHTLATLLGLEEQECVDVLYLSVDGLVAGGVATTPYFWQEDGDRDYSGKWVTPARDTGCYRGVTRRFSLEGGLCVEGAVPLKSLCDGDRVWLSNSVSGWGWGPLKIVEL